MYLCRLDYLHCYQAPPTIQKVQPALHYNTIENASCPVPYHNGLLASTAQHYCLLNVILPQDTIYTKLSTPDNESKLLLHQNGEFIRNIIFNMTMLHYQIPYIDCTPSNTFVFSIVKFSDNKKDLDDLRQSGKDNQALDATSFHVL